MLVVPDDILSEKCSICDEGLWVLLGLKKLEIFVFDICRKRVRTTVFEFLTTSAQARRISTQGVWFHIHFESRLRLIKSQRFISLNDEFG